MKFTSVAVLALFLANTQAVNLNKEAKAKDDCGGKWCNKGLSYDFDEATLHKAEADNVAKTHAFNGATKAQETAAANHAAASAAAAATAAADAEAGAAKSEASAKFAGTHYKSGEFSGAESTNAAAVKAKEATLDASLKAFDDQVEKTHILNRKNRDLAAATAAKAASDANLKSNQERVAYEKDQLHRGENQDRLKELDEKDKAKTSEIDGKHDERERANGRLFKALASF